MSIFIFILNNDEIAFFIKISKSIISLNMLLLAERKGFEPLIRLLIYTLSKRAPSTTRPPLPNKT